MELQHFEKNCPSERHNKNWYISCAAIDACLENVQDTVHRALADRVNVPNALQVSQRSATEGHLLNPSVTATSSNMRLVFITCVRRDISKHISLPDVSSSVLNHVACANAS